MSTFETRDDATRVTSARTISIEVRSRSLATPPTLRVSRSAAIAPGTLSLTMIDGEVVVACPRGAAIEQEARIDDAGAPVVSIAVREGLFEVQFEAGAGCASVDDATTPGETESPVRTALAIAPLVKVAPGVVRDAEWQPVEAVVETPARARPMPLEVVTIAPRPHASFSENDDGPTRIAPLDEIADDAGDRMPQARAASAPKAPPIVVPETAAAPARPKIRRGVRQVALFALLASAFMLWLHAIRLRHAHALRAHAPATASSGAVERTTRVSAGAAPSAGASSSVAHPAVVADMDGAPGPVDSTSPPAASASANPGDVWSRAAARRPTGTRARAAADALANGAWGDALAIYEDLAAGSPNDPAYAELVRILRARSKTAR